MTTDWVPKCKYCGKIDKFQAGYKKGSLPPTEDVKPSSWMGSRCEDSPTGYHKLEWIRYYR